MAEIEENKSSYDFRETNLPAFYKQYLPDFKDKDGSYTLGFSAVFNQYKAKDSIQDAENRNKYAGEQKILGISKLISVSENAPEAWGVVDSYTKSKLPNGTYASNEEGIQGMLRHIENTYSAATSH
jgi:outer membrane receptor for monomeric catechols